MPNKQKHRGPHPQDEELFRAEMLPDLRVAVHDLSWLLSRGYTETASLKLVGDRFQLRDRQRKTVLRASCSDESLQTRIAKEIQPETLSGKAVWLDGFNILITLEAALSGGFLFRGREGCIRDLSSIHGSYRKVEETENAVKIVGNWLNQWNPAEIHWLLDAPVSNSGRLKTLMAEVAEAEGWEWDIQLVQNPDADLIACGDAIISSDGVILDKAAGWVNLVSHVLEEGRYEVRLLDLSENENC